MGDTNIEINNNNSEGIQNNVSVNPGGSPYTETKKTNWFLENIVLVVILGVVSSIIASFII